MCKVRESGRAAKNTTFGPRGGIRGVRERAPDKSYGCRRETVEQRVLADKMRHSPKISNDVDGGLFGEFVETGDRPEQRRNRKTPSAV